MLFKLFLFDVGPVRRWVVWHWKGGLIFYIRASLYIAEEREHGWSSEIHL